MDVASLSIFLVAVYTLLNLSRFDPTPSSAPSRCSDSPVARATLPPGGGCKAEILCSTHGGPKAGIHKDGTMLTTKDLALLRCHCGFLLADMMELAEDGSLIVTCRECGAQHDCGKGLPPLNPN